MIKHDTIEVGLKYEKPKIKKRLSLNKMAKLVEKDLPLDPNKYYRISTLVKAFTEAGIPRSEMWIRRQEYKGNIKLPRSTTDFKKPQGTRKMAAVRVMTGRQIQAIVKAFLPGGPGCYNYEESNP